MSARKKGRATPEKAFQDDVSASKPLSYCKGLQAIKKGEGKGQISGQDSTKILGSVAIDDDCCGTHPNDNRWDYVIGYDRSKHVIAHYVEVHSAESSEVVTVERKLDWLETFLQDENREELSSFERAYHWVASGRINIPQHTPQYKKLHTILRKRGLRGPVKALVMV